MTDYVADAEWITWFFIFIWMGIWQNNTLAAPRRDSNLEILNQKLFDFALSSWNPTKLYQTR